MTLGELADMLAELKYDEARVADAELALEYGGSEDTMRRKREVLEEAQRYLHNTRNREIKL